MGGRGVTAGLQKIQIQSVRIGNFEPGCSTQIKEGVTSC